MAQITGTLQEGPYTFVIVSHSILHKIRNVSDKSCRENQNTNFKFNFGNYLSIRTALLITLHRISNSSMLYASCKTQHILNSYRLKQNSSNRCECKIAGFCCDLPQFFHLLGCYAAV
jgi:hypothetical protein